MNRRSDGAVFQPQLLDVDESIKERNLRIVDSEDGGLEALLGPRVTSQASDLRVGSQADADLPSVEVSPAPGICIKTKNIGGKKVFVNLCKISEIPPPPPITEEKLQAIVASEDYDSDFRVPMSLGAPRKEVDKTGASCLACDVAINTGWFEDVMENSIVFTTFVVHVTMEGLGDKYGDECNLDRQNWVILKNKKYLGRLQRHRIQMRAKGRKIQELDELPATRLQNSNEDVKMKTPKFKLMKEPKSASIPDYLIAEILLPGVNSKSDLTLDLGEDRIVLESKRHSLLLDVFIPFFIDPAVCCAQFHRDKHIMTVTMPIRQK